MGANVPEILTVLASGQTPTNHGDRDGDLMYQPVSGSILTFEPVGSG